MKKIESISIGEETARAQIVYEFDGDVLVLLLPKRGEIPCLQMAERDAIGRLRENGQAWINIKNMADVSKISRELKSAHDAHLRAKKKSKK